jgi:hypothetical protein
MNIAYTQQPSKLTHYNFQSDISFRVDVLYMKRDSSQN